MEQSFRRDEKLLFLILKTFKFLRNYEFDIFEIHATGPETSVRILSKSRNLKLYFLSECGSGCFEVSILQKKIFYEKEIMAYDLVKDHRKRENLIECRDCNNIEDKLEKYAKVFESEIIPVLEANKWRL